MTTVCNIPCIAGEFGSGERFDKFGELFKIHLTKTILRIIITLCLNLSIRQTFLRQISSQSSSPVKTSPLYGMLYMCSHSLDTLCKYL